MQIIPSTGEHQHNQPQSPFDSIKHLDEQGREHWSARELMPILGYSRWNEFLASIDRAKLACENTGNLVTEHFSGCTRKNSPGRGRPQEDYKLSRYAAYLISLNGDPRKPEIANAQAYFVVKTREAEVREQQQVIEPPKPMSQIEILQVAINQLVEQEKRTQELERRQQQTEEALAKIFRDKLEAQERLNALPAPTVTAPPVTVRQLVRRTVNDFCTRSGASQQDIWKKLYQEIFYRCGICLNKRERVKNQSKLDILTESELNQLYAIAVEILV